MTSRPGATSYSLSPHLVHRVQQGRWREVREEARGVRREVLSSRSSLLTSRYSLLTSRSSLRVPPGRGRGVVARPSGARAGAAPRAVTHGVRCALQAPSFTQKPTGTKVQRVCSCGKADRAVKSRRADGLPRTATTVYLKTRYGCIYVSLREQARVPQPSINTVTSHNTTAARLHEHP